VNVARGPIVDKEALANALRTGRLRAALLDVTVPSPLPPDDPQWDVPNLWITPLDSGNTHDGFARAIDLFCSNLRLYLDGHPERMGSIAQLPSHT
jgi:phosphoglycerate dehydrogenase-like enzyme